MKLILSFLLLFLLATGPALAAVSPGAALTTDSSRRYVYLTFTNLQSVSRVTYTLTYDSNSVTRGFEGGFKTLKGQRRSVRRQILGTCSSGRCVFHKNPVSFQLTVRFYLKTGGSTTVTKSLL